MVIVWGLSLGNDERYVSLKRSSTSADPFCSSSRCQSSRRNLRVFRGLNILGSSLRSAERSSVLLLNAIFVCTVQTKFRSSSKSTHLSSIKVLRMHHSQTELNEYLTSLCRSLENVPFRISKHGIDFSRNGWRCPSSQRSFRDPTEFYIISVYILHREPNVFKEVPLTDLAMHLRESPPSPTGKPVDPNLFGSDGNFVIVFSCPLEVPAGARVVIP